MIKYKICIFSYSFKHTKSYDFIKKLSKKKLLNLVIAAPKRKIFIKSKWQPKQTKLFKKKNILDPHKLCKRMNINYVKLNHDKFSDIKKIVRQKGCNIAVISGSRILNSKIINLFKYGVINFHPGKIPETSGLDSFFWMIKKNVDPYVTAHFIDKYVDRGKIIFKEKITVKKNDDFFSLKNRIYKSEINLLEKICNLFITKKIIKSKSVKNYSKNEQLSTNEKKLIYENKFLQFKKQRLKF